MWMACGFCIQTTSLWHPGPPFPPSNFVTPLPLNVPQSYDASKNGYREYSAPKNGGWATVKWDKAGDYWWAPRCSGCCCRGGLSSVCCGSPLCRGPPPGRRGCACGPANRGCRHFPFPTQCHPGAAPPWHRYACPVKGHCEAGMRQKWSVKDYCEHCSPGNLPAGKRRSMQRCIGVPQLAPAYLRPCSSADLCLAASHTLDRGAQTSTRRTRSGCCVFIHAAEKRRSASGGAGASGMGALRLAYSSARQCTPCHCPK